MYEQTRVVPQEPPHGLTAWWFLESARPGRSPSQKISFPANSFVRNFLRLFLGLVSSGLMYANWFILDTTGASRNAGNVADDQANGANRILGAQFGSGTTPVTPTDFKIETLVSGVILASAVTEVVVGNTTSYQFTITFANPTGSDILINEAVVVVGMTWGNITRACIISRDVFDSTFTLPAGETLLAVFTLQITS